MASYGCPHSFAAFVSDCGVASEADDGEVSWVVCSALDVWDYVVNACAVGSAAVDVVEWYVATSALMVFAPA